MDDNQLLQETLRLAKENNRMLHTMRRNAFWGGIIKFVVYAALLIGLPLWLYATYLAPVVQSMQHAVNQIQGTGAQAQAQFGDLQNFWHELQERFHIGTSSSSQ